MKNKLTIGIIIAYCLAFATACLYAPWKLDFDKYKMAMQYAPLWDPPTLGNFAPGAYLTIDLSRVSLELAALTVIAIAFIAIVRIMNR